MTTISVNSNSTLDLSSDSWLFSVTRDENGWWILTDRQTDVWGHGRSLLEAMCDYWSALHSHLSVNEDGPASPRLNRQSEAIRVLLALAPDATKESAA